MDQLEGIVLVSTKDVMIACAVRRLNPATTANPRAAQRNLSAVPICAHSDGESGCGSIRRSLFQLHLTGRQSQAAGKSFSLANRCYSRWREIPLRAHIYLICLNALVSTRKTLCRIKHSTNSTSNTQKQHRSETATACRVRQTQQPIPTTIRHHSRIPAT